MFSFKKKYCSRNCIVDFGIGISFYSKNIHWKHEWITRRDATKSYSPYKVLYVMLYIGKSVHCDPVSGRRKILPGRKENGITKSDSQLFVI